MQVEVKVGTRRSRRHTVNQDRAVVGDRVLDHTSEVLQARLQGPSLLAVLDGLGGHSAGETASQLAGEHLAAAEVPTDVTAAVRLLEHADRLLHEAGRSDPDRAGMGTTAALLALGADGEDAVVANAGDSTIWLLTDDGLEELSESDRAVGSAIVQCLGANRVGISPHARRVPLSAGDRLLLASDGLTDVLSREAIGCRLRGDATAAVAELMDVVGRAGPPDDVTIILVDVVAP